MATKSLTLNQAFIGPASWRNGTLKGIQMAHQVVRNSDKDCEMGKSIDPLPNLRDTVAELSNDEAHRYFRHTRAVVCMLRESMLDTNEEIKSLSRGKEALEKTLENIRKDIQLNGDSQDVRLSRPMREKGVIQAGLRTEGKKKKTKVDKDGADDLLQAERMHLLNLKRMLESELLLVQQQLQVLDASRRRLSNVIQERSRVLDLICHALPSVNGNTALSMTNRYHSSPGRLTSRSSPVGGNDSPFTVDPLGAYTPEADAALNEAKDARMRSMMLRKDLGDAIDRADKTQKTAHSSVNSGLTHKLAETIALKQQLQVAAGQNRHATNRAQRWYDSTEKAWGYSRGPVSSGDMTNREKLNRPIISVFQRHPGTNLPEAQEIVRGGDGLLNSLHTTSRNIGLLKLANLQLQDDIRDKNRASDVDSGVIRMRRRKANHRWVMGQAY